MFPAQEGGCLHLGGNTVILEAFGFGAGVVESLELLHGGLLISLRVILVCGGTRVAILRLDGVELISDFGLLTQGVDR
jgi:hypothetical protein